MNLEKKKLVALMYFKRLQQGTQFNFFFSYLCFAIIVSIIDFDDSLFV